MSYNKVGWNNYDDDLTFEENLERNAIATDRLLNHMDDGIEKANNLKVGTVETGGETGSLNITEDEDGYKLNIKFPDTNKGEKGDKGDPGEKGDKGEAGTITVGTVATGEPGTNVSISNTGSASNAILNFTIPKGEKGDPGEPGKDGENGYGVPLGGTAGQVLKKASDADGDTQWVDDEAFEPLIQPTISIGEVVTGEAGTPASVTNSGTDINAVLNFTIPKGDNGYIGTDGFSPTIKENADNTEDVYKLDITTKDGSFTTPNLKGESVEPEQNGVYFMNDNSEANPLVLNDLTPGMYVFPNETIYLKAFDNSSTIYSGKSVDRQLFINKQWTEDLTGMDAFGYYTMDNMGTCYISIDKDKQDDGGVHETIAPYIAKTLTTDSDATITGTFTFSQNLPESNLVPTKDEHLVNKKYVDDSIPSALPNPNKLIFTGSVEGEYNGSVETVINIPEPVSDYSELNNLPTLNGVTLKGELTPEGLGIQPAGNYAEASTSRHITLKSINGDNTIDIAIKA